MLDTIFNLVPDALCRYLRKRGHVLMRTSDYDAMLKMHTEELGRERQFWYEREENLKRGHAQDQVANASQMRGLVLERRRAEEAMVNLAQALAGVAYNADAEPYYAGTRIAQSWFNACIERLRFQRTQLHDLKAKLGPFDAAFRNAMTAGKDTDTVSISVPRGTVHALVECLERCR